jgi:hypothetical protein
MSDEALKQPVPSDIQWEPFTTAKGRKYEVGRSQGGSAPANALGAANASGAVNASGLANVLAAEAVAAPIAAGGKRDFGIAVSWAVGDTQWKNTSPDVRERSAITRYKLYEYDGSWKYMLEFSNEEHYDYYFYDETGDKYEVNTFRNGDHYVRYDSDQPNIVFISGS